MDAWSKIDELAKGLVEKADGSLTHEQAVSRVLKSREGAALYAEYNEEEQVAQLRLGGYVPKAGDLSTRVQKAVTAAGSIDELARRLQEKHPDWTLEQCVRKVLETPEGRDLWRAHENAQRGGSVAQPTSRMEGPGAARAGVRKGERVQLSKAAERFVADFEAWLREPSGRVDIAKYEDDPLEALLDDLGL